MSAVPVAIVSIGALFPGAPTTEAFWRDIVEGRDRLTEVPRTHWLASDHFDPTPGTLDKVYTTRGGFLSDVDFSPMEFGLPPSTLPATDTCQLLALVVAKRVLAEATRGRWESMDCSRISVLLGVASATELCAHMSGRLQIPVVEAAMRAAGVPEDDSRRVRAALEACYVPWQENTFPGLLGNVVAGRIANRFDLGGTNAVLDAACAGSLAAVDMAVQELSLGVSDMVITGGVDTLNDILMFMCFAQTGALSRSGDCRPFSKDADGTMLGEGIGLFALRRLADAERDGDPIYAVIRGIGASSDGRGTSIYAPLAAGQVRALDRAYAQAGASPKAIGLVEAHGTGTVAGDATELVALREVYERAGASPKQTAIGSVKGQIGHTKAAAGAAGLAKAALALHHKVFPPTIKVGEPLPTLADPSCPFYASTAVRPWVESAGRPRRAAVSALGFGGTNFHVVLEEHRGSTPRPPRMRALPAELVLLGASDAMALAARCRDEAARLGDPGALVHLAKRSQLAFSAASPVRLALVAASEDALADLLRRAADAVESGGAHAVRGCSFGVGPAAGPVALLFPGQGSQSVGMGSDLAIHFDDARAVWDEAAALDVFAEEGLHDRVFPPPALSDEERDARAARLTATAWAQPALCCASLAMLRLCRRVGLVPVAVGGHSLGEITALAAGDALSALDAIRLARTRGTLMEAASRGAEGAMIAVTADRARVEALLDRVRLPVTLANYNAPRQLVISGQRAAIEALAAHLGEEGVAAQRLAVATAFHSPLVEAACAPLRRALDEVALAPTAVPVYSNVTAAPYPTDPGAVRDQLASAVAQPVRFVEQVEAMYSAGARTFVEVGPGRVLTQLVGRCLEGRPNVAVALDRPGEHGVTAFFHAIGQLAAAGVALDLAPLWEGQALPADPASRPVMKHTVRLNGANFGKPYPAAAEQALAHARPTSTRATMSQPPKPPQPAPDTADLLTSVRELQAPLIAAQMEYEKVMAESHSAFLRAVEASYAALSGSLGVPLAPIAPIARVAPIAPVVPVAAGTVAPSPAIPSPPSRMHAPPRPPAAQANGSGHVLAPAPEPVRPLLIPAKPVLSSPAELLLLIRSVVADKTGYPVEMIEPTMDLEYDLGIDSIKRVEILAALRERAPGLPDIEPAHLGKFRTLEDIVRSLGVGSDEPSPTPANETRPRVEIARYVVEPRPSPAMGLATPGLFGDGVLAVIPDDRGIAPLLCVLLKGHGIRAEVVALVPPEARGVIFLSGLSNPATLDDALGIERDAFEAARVFARRAKEGGKLFVTVQDTGGDLGFSGSSGDRAWLAGLAALAKTAAEEWPRSCARAIDIERGDRDPGQIAETLVNELLAGGSEREVGLAANGARHTLVSTPRPHLAAGKSVLREGDVVVVSGGARGVTAACALALARAIKPRLVLIGRTALTSESARFQGVVGDAELKRAALEAAQETGASTAPRDIAREVARVTAAREARATLGRLAELGIEARYEAVDVRNAGALEALFTDVRAGWGPVRGLVHGAGVLADALLEDRPDGAQLDGVLDTKVRGLAALLGATQTDPLAWICLFSSAAARAGNAGQADYAMANEILNKVAAAEARRRGERAQVVSIGWGPWDGGMVTPALARHFASRGIGLIPLDEGAAAFVREADGLVNGSSRADGSPSAEVLLGSAQLASSAASRRGEVWIDSATMPQLEDHRVRGTVVLPIVMAIEWFARIAAPGPISLHDVHIRRGMLIPAYGRAGQCAEIVATPALDGVSLELRDASAGVRIVARAGAASAHLPQAPRGTGGIVLDGPLYGPDRLFHGPQFQVLAELHALSPEGGRASVKGTLDLSWRGGPWRTDPAAIDGALQLALLSSLAAGMGPTLPLRIAEVINFEPPVRGPIACVVEMRSRSAERAIFDAWLTGPRGEPVAALRGIEMFLAPSGTGV